MMSKFVVNKDSVNEIEYQVYIDTSTETVIAVKRNAEGEEKVQETGRKYRYTKEGIPDSETVTGIILKLNPQNGKHEIHSGMEHEFKIKDLRFPTGRQIFFE